MSDEDNIILEYFPKGYIGNCIEIGAADGIAGSNTYMFEQNGWECLCIEANPKLANKCSQVRKNTLNYAVGKENLPTVNFTIFDVGYNNESAISSISVDQRLVEAHKHLIQNTYEISIELKTLDTILGETNLFNYIDYVSIDTEGTELDVLKGFDLNKWKPKVLLIENNYEDKEIEEYLLNFKYKKVLRHHVNDFYLL
jgi:FkbM family methyltransferase